MNKATFKEEISIELDAILNWWLTNMPDYKQGGFLGAISNDHETKANTAKGLVLNSRILWTFSAAALQTGNKNYLTIADRAFTYLVQHFYDPQYGGFFWSVDHNGNMHDSKKQVYGQAFAIYGLSEYYKAAKNERALVIAIETFDHLELYAWDKNHKGYFEAFTREWSTITDMRLSDKDQNEKKSMNTHLHVIEACSNLYSVCKEEKLKSSIQNLLDIFNDHIINKNTNHLNLFFSESWENKSTAISFGHDIEAAWLLQECAEAVGDRQPIDAFKTIAVQMADAANEGIDQDGGMWNECDPSTHHWNKEKHWWQQAEAMVGFINAWQISGNEKYLQTAISSWTFIQTHLKDSRYGEWFWGINEDGSIMQTEDKAGFWKCPYHNGRACLEIIKRIK